MTASSFWSSTSILRSVLCALDEPKSTPSGTMTAARPPGLSRRRKSARKSSSVFLVLTICRRSLARVFVVERSGKRRIGEDERVFLLFAGVVLRQRVAVADVGILHAVQQHVHAADAEHRVVEVEAVEKLMVEVAREFGVAKYLRMALAQIFAGGDEKTGRAACRIADDVRRLRRDHLDHQPDDVPRRAELAVLAGSGDLAEHVLVQVALGVALLHRHLVDHVDDLREQARRRDREPRVLHVMRVGGLVAAQRPQERKDVLADDVVHVGRREMLEPRPAVVLVRARRARMVVLTLRKQPPLDRLFEPGRFQLFERLQLVQPLDEKQVSDLLDDFQRIGNAAGPEGIPDLVNLVANFVGQHKGSVVCCSDC